MKRVSAFKRVSTHKFLFIINSVDENVSDIRSALSDQFLISTVTTTCIKENHRIITGPTYKKFDPVRFIEGIYTVVLFHSLETSVSAPVAAVDKI